MSLNQVLKVVAGNVVRVVFPRIAYPVLSGPLKGRRFILGALAGRACGSSVYLGLVERDQTRAVQAVLTHGQIFFDIGANVGYYSILASSLVGHEGKVVAIEPSVRNLVYLYRHRQLNRAENLMILPAACADRTGIASFVEGSTFAEGHLSPKVGVSDTFGARKSTVFAISVDDFVEAWGLAPDVIKVDVEGAELSVLRGAIRTLEKKAPYIFLSVHSPVLRRNCLQFMQTLGYSFKSLDGDDSSASAYLLAR